MAHLPVAPQIAGTDNEGNLVSYYDTSTGELHLGLFVVDQSDPTSPFYTDLIEITITPDSVTHLT